MFESSNFCPKNVGGSKPITDETSVLLALWYFANTESFRQVSDRFNVSLSSAHRCLERVVNFLLSKKSDFIKWPSEVEAKRNSNQFKKKNGIDHIIGAIDGCHIKINKPGTNQDSYVNRKGYHSILLQGVVNHEKLFIDVYCGEPGSLHDSRLLRKSHLYAKACDNERSLFYDRMFLLADSAYPSLSWIVPPFRDNGNLTEEQKKFNFKHSSTRIVVENAYGLLKGRFRLFHLENLDIKFSVKCVMACCVLHNICILNNNELLMNYECENEAPEYEENGDENTGDRRGQIFQQLLENGQL